MDKSLIVYDGECVFCQNYVRFFRLREAIGPVELLDARSGDPRVEALWRQGYDLDEGMVFAHRGRVFHGAEAVQVLASLSSRSGLFNRLNAAIFRSPAVARMLYPALKLGRRATLMARGRSLMRPRQD
ncbi:DCC1-like thiol-disulfide oxidoreductase family protein [Sphingomonas sp. IW22]|uniref:DCC1-like thiol-disulfide oxidoreductase family protein n=1 Tax=Sphingomonas sp. IW22 TaxID=3242489 RepID=UPI00351F843C